MPQTNRLNLPTRPPRLQVDNRAVWNDSRSPEQADFFTIGYTGRTVQGILNLLISHGVRTLVDIRQNAVSMYRPEVSKTNLRSLVERHGIQYVHSPELGVPRDIRAKSIETGTRDVIWDWYDRYVIPSYLGNLHRFLNSVEHPVALMCVEVDPRECHRHRLFMALEEMGLKGFDL